MPAISITAHARDEDRMHALAMGFQAHLAKPVARRLLITTVHTFCSLADGNEPALPIKDSNR